jgi:hypothetical protein
MALDAAVVLDAGDELADKLLTHPVSVMPAVSSPITRRITLRAG